MMLLTFFSSVLLVQICNIPFTNTRYTHPPTFDTMIQSNQACSETIKAPPPQPQAYLPGCMHFPINTWDNQKQGCCVGNPNAQRTLNKASVSLNGKSASCKMYVLAGSLGDILHTGEVCHVAIKSKRLLRSWENPADFRTMSTALLIREIAVNLTQLDWTQHDFHMAS